MPTAYRCVFACMLAAILSGCATPLELPTAASTPSGGLATLASSLGPGSKPGSGSTDGFYPLQLGNHWLLRRRSTVAVIPSQGDPPALVEYEATIDRQLICAERRGDRQYMIERVEEQDPTSIFRYWIGYRQDRTGLYETDGSMDPPPCVSTAIGHESRTAVALDSRIAELVPTATPARQAAFRAAAQRLSARLATLDRVLRSMPAAPSQASGTGMAGVGELTRLSYPLRPGARWIIRAEPGATFSATVEAADVLDLRVGRLLGYRIRIRSDLFGPADVVRVWYGPAGYLQLAAHLEFDAVDISGQPVGRVATDERETLVFVQLAGPSFTFAPSGGRYLGR